MILQNKKILLFITLILALSLLNSLRAEDKDDHFYGSFLLGYRMVDTSGVETKYKEDINLEKGPRLFHFNLHYLPDGKLKKLFDRLDLTVRNFGGDPFETFGLSVIKYGTYDFKYNRRKSAYFYSDILEGHDFRTFDFDRITDSGLLKIWLGSKIQFYVDFDRYTKTGNSTISYDINRIEFEFDKPVEEKSSEIAVGLDLDLKCFSLVLEEKIQEYENTHSLFLPGYADGGANASYPSSLDYFYLDQPFDFTSYTHTARLNARPFSNLLIRAAAVLSTQDTDVSYSEEAGGIDYLGKELAYSYSGGGSFERSIQLYDLDLSYLLGSKLAVVGAVRYHNFDQDGSFTVDGKEKSAAWEFNTLGFEGGLQYQASSKFGFTLGFRREQREIEQGVEELVKDTTQRTGFFGNLNMKFSKEFKLGADYQYGSYKDVFTLISPTDFHRFRLSAKYWKKPFHLTASYLLNKSESSIDDDLWKADKNQLNLRFGYHQKKVKLSLGYGLIDIKREGDRTVAYPPSWSGPAGTFLWEILYEGKSHLFDAYLHLKLNPQWAVGGYLNSYQNKGSWELSRFMWKAFVEYTFAEGFILHLAHRYVDFQEKISGYNDYSANITEISFGYRW
jgi:hypothetical protein